MSDFAIAFERARIVREVALVAELTRIHKDRGDHYVTGLAGRTKERLVSSVQGAHGRHQTDTSTRRAFVVGELAPRGYLREFNHGAEVSRRCSASSKAARARATYVARSLSGIAAR